MSPLSLLLLLSACSELAHGFIDTLVGGSITWRLHPQFEINRIIYFKLRLAFDKTDGLDAASGVTLDLYKTPSGPSLVHGDKFGILSVETVSVATTGDPGSPPVVYPNKFIIVEIDGDIIHGEMEVEYVLPPNVFSTTAKMRRLDGQSLILGEGNVGGLPNCNTMGVSQSPCTLNLGLGGTRIATPLLFDLIAKS